MPDYRDVFRENVRALLRYRGELITDVRAYWIAGGTKQGKRVSKRMIQYWLEDREDAPSPTLDGIAALARYFGVEVWQLLVPGMRPEPAKRPVCVVTERHRRLIKASDEPEGEVSPLTEEVARELLEQEDDDHARDEDDSPTRKRRSDTEVPATRPPSGTVADKRKRSARKQAAATARRKVKI